MTRAFLLLIFVAALAAAAAAPTASAGIFIFHGCGPHTGDHDVGASCEFNWMGQENSEGASCDPHTIGARCVT